MRPLARERSMLFDGAAQAYRRSRPTYPDPLLTEVLGPHPNDLRVLDVGCGTGIASILMAQRGAEVVGVEPAARMAAIAHSAGIEVEVSSFEEWDPAGRTFDRVTSAQAWHWLDLDVATAKAAAVLRTGGRLCLFWNSGHHPDALSDALADVYARIVPPDAATLFVGYAANRSADMRDGLTSVVNAIAEAPGLGPPETKYFPWVRSYQREQWIDQLLSRSDHLALDAAVRGRLFAAVSETIDRFGGSFEMKFETVLISAASP